MRRKKNVVGGLLKGLLAPLVIVAALLVFATAVNSLDSGRDEESLRQLEVALHRGCAACYAAEGIYPPDVAYLRDRYGIQVDEEKYMVDYQVFAKNLMPSITVLERKQ